MNDAEMSWTFVFSFSELPPVAEQMEMLKDEMTTIMDHRKVYREPNRNYNKVDYIYQGISPEDALKYMHRLSTRTYAQYSMVVKIYNMYGDTYVPS